MYFLKKIKDLKQCSCFRQKSCWSIVLENDYNIGIQNKVTGPLEKVTGQLQKLLVSDCGTSLNREHWLEGYTCTVLWGCSLRKLKEIYIILDILIPQVYGLSFTPHIHQYGAPFSVIVMPKSWHTYIL